VSGCAARARRADALTQLRTAHDTFAAIGMQVFAEGGRRELLATGETVRTRTVDTHDQLTPQEAPNRAAALFTAIALPFIAGTRSRRRARPAEPGADDATPVEYVYVPCARIRHRDFSAETRRWVQEVPIVKKTAKRIYYTSDSWDRHEATVSPGCISREQFETDTRCRDDCPRDIATGLVCVPHGRGSRHCVHVLAPGRHCRAPGGCGEDCPADARGVRCARHGYTWEHCPHGEDRCRHGYPAGVIPIPGARPGSAGRLFFATRHAAEYHLYRGERGRAGHAARVASLIRELRRAMADTHPDRGGRAEQFIQARRRYETALWSARR
jgi:hypothetical protein